jgi:hypothetical protein
MALHVTGTVELVPLTIRDWWCHTCGRPEADETTRLCAECAYMQGPQPVMLPTRVDGHEHGRACVPPWSETLAAIVDGHLAAVEAKGAAHVLDPEGLYHLQAGTAAVVAMERLLPPAPPPEEERHSCAEVAAP